MDYYLRVDGQNFDNTIGDNDELSTLRGGGLALLYAPQNLFLHLKRNGYSHLETVYCGASEGLARIPISEGDEKKNTYQNLFNASQQFLAGLAGPDEDPGKKIRPFLTFSIALRKAEEVDFERVTRELANLNREAQLKNLTLDCLPDFDDFKENNKTHEPPPSNLVPCAFDHTRPARAWVWKSKEDNFQVSHSVYVRQRYGRRLRQIFYAEELKPSQTGWNTHQEILEKILGKKPGVRFADSFDELAIPPTEHKVPQKLQNKMAVLYLDGNNFNKLKSKHCKSPKAAQSFSEFILKTRRSLLGKMVEQVCGSSYFKKNRHDEIETVIPMETLLWGGDEVLWVMPAWSVMKVLENLEPILARGWDWQIPDSKETVRLSHSLGLVVCHYKTPIRQVRALAEELANDAKSLKDQSNNNIGRKNCHLQIMTLMSVDPPDSELGVFRKRFYGTEQPAAFTMAFDGAFGEKTLTTLRAFKGNRGLNDEVPLSQLYELRRLAIENDLLCLPDSNSRYVNWEKKAKSILADYTGPDGRPFQWGNLKQANLGYGPRHPLMPLFHLLGLWDLLDPFAT